MNSTSFKAMGELLNQVTGPWPSKNITETLSRLPPEGQAWLNDLNPFCRWALEHDLRFAPDLFVRHWESLRDTLQKLERDFGPSEGQFGD